MTQVFLSHVFKDLKVEKATSPDVTVLLRFLQVFPALDWPPKHLNFMEVTEPTLVTKQPELSAKIRRLLSQNFTRDDYKKFLKLVIVLLKRFSITGQEEFLICGDTLTYGAVHKARWMSKVIYSIMIVLYKDETAEKDLINIFKEGPYDKLVCFFKFV